MTSPYRTLPEDRMPWVRYRLERGETVLTFRVPKGTPMVLEQAGWDVTTSRWPQPEPADD